MDLLTTITLAAHLSPRESLEIVWAANSTPTYKQKLYVTGACGAKAGDNIRTMFQSGAVLSVELIEYGPMLLATHQCLFCRNPHGLGPFEKYYEAVP